MKTSPSFTMLVRIRGAEEPFVLPLGAAFAGGVDGDATLGELAQSGDVVGVNVRIGGGDDAELVLGGEVEVAIDIAFGVHDDGFTGAGASDEVGVLGELGVEDLSHEHGSLRGRGVAGSSKTN
jgi:hypothetical protein